MNHDDRFHDLERRANEGRVSVARVLRAADIAASTWTRWKQGFYSPTAESWAKVEAALERLLRERAP